MWACEILQTLQGHRSQNTYLEQACQEEERPVTKIYYSHCYIDKILFNLLSKAYNSQHILDNLWQAKMHVHATVSATMPTASTTSTLSKTSNSVVASGLLLDYGYSHDMTVDASILAH